MSLQIRIQNGLIIIDSKLTLSTDALNSLNFHKILKPSLNGIYDDTNTEICNNIVEVAKILNCYVKNIKYETVHDYEMKWILPTHIIFQKNNKE